MGRGLRTWLGLVALGPLLLPCSLEAATLEDKTSFGTNASSRHLFHYNPALLQVDKTTLAAIHVAGRRTYSVIGSPDNAPTRLDATLEEKEQAAGLLVPLGGASLGLTHALVTRDNIHRNENVDREAKESERERRWSLRFVVDLATATRFGFSYKYAALQDQVYGNYGLPLADFTSYRASLNGYTIGLAHDEANWGIALYHAPPMRGKAEVEGEQKILTEPGTSGLDVIVRPSRQFHFGAVFTRWFHKRDDFAPLSTSPTEQRRISLNGIDLEQYLFPVQSTQVGMDYFFQQEWSVRLAVSKNTAAYIFDEGTIPGEDRNREQRFDWYGAKASAAYAKNSFHLELGKIYGQRKKDRFRDPQGTFGHGTYAKYRAKDDFFFLALSFDT